MTARDYKDTCLLPETGFAMKADLAKRETQWLERWRTEKLYDQMLARPAEKNFVFHDGPPYANGDLHYGHVLNHALKDFVIRFRNLVGERARFVPGWDCHGLPIELKVDKRLGGKKRAMSALEVREECRREAEKWVGVQGEQRQRIGALGTWDAPYLTMDPAYEAAIIRALRAFVDRELVYRGRKPVQWCANDRTALAEAEVEYIEQHVSPSVYVKFPADAAAETALRARFPKTRAAKLFALIWTTTPWTLPANLAIALHPEVEYVLLDVERDGAVEAWLLAAPLVDAVRAATGATEKTSTVHRAANEADGKGASLVGLAFRHPWEDRESRLVAADYVETETGTGLVHTAPGHGRDDYATGMKHGLDAYAPLDDAGRFTDDLGAGSQALGLVGKTVWEANPLIVQSMADRGVLANRPGATITHKYPGCWRCHKPLITRATVQWFIALDTPMKGGDGSAGTSLRQRALEEIDRLAAEGETAAAALGRRGGNKVDARGWVPAWGRERIHGMIAARPDWCISRQRVWGVPIPALHCAKCQHATLTSALLEHVATVFAVKGAGAWFDPALEAEVIPAGFACEKCGATDGFTRDQSILDVWFESGSSFYAVCEAKPDLGVPVDLYLEGSDQHRGWFHSSLLVGIALRGTAPFRTVLTHGFIQGRPTPPLAKAMAELGLKDLMSKSTLDALEAKKLDVSAYRPQSMIKAQGAELLRAWAAYEDYRGDVELSPEHFTQVADAYRKIRNTFRFMLQVMRREAPAPVATASLEPLDRWALAGLADIVAESERAYRAYEFRAVFVGALEYLNDLSAFYLDVIKDWLYNDAPDSPRRRSTLATVDTIVRAMATVLAALLPFTMEDVWDHLPRRAGDPASVHLTTWRRVPAPADAPALADAAAAVRDLRDRVHGALEPLVQAWGVERQAAKKAGDAPGEGGNGRAVLPENARIDHARDALAVVSLPAAEIARLGPLRATLAESLVIGELQLLEGSEVAVGVRRAPWPPCERCRRRRSDVGSEGRAAGLCARCAEAVRIYDAKAGTSANANGESLA